MQQAQESTLEDLEAFVELVEELGYPCRRIRLHGEGPNYLITVPNHGQSIRLCIFRGTIAASDKIPGMPMSGGMGEGDLEYRSLL